MTEARNTFHIGPIRPPSEASSLLLQVTNGCTWNRCKFCQLYRHTKFRAYSVDEVKADIDAIRRIADIVEGYRRRQEDTSNGAAVAEEWDITGINEELGRLAGVEQESFYMVANWLVGGGKNVFLQDGNSLILSGGKLSEVLRYLKEAFPTIERITSYGRAENLSKVSAEEFAELKEAGLDRIHSGFESGSDAVLALVNKGTTSEEQIRAGKAIKEGGIELSVYFMPGLGGRDLSEENARGMARVVNAVGPDFLRIRTCAVKPGTELAADMEAGLFRLTGDDDKVRELRLLIELSDVDGMLVSDHIINLLPDVCGHVQRDRAAMLDTIDRYLARPDKGRRLYQFARRLFLVERPEDMTGLSMDRISGMRAKVEETPVEDWDAMMNDMIARYI